MIASGTTGGFNKFYSKRLVCEIGGCGKIGAVKRRCNLSRSYAAITWENRQRNSPVAGF